MRYLALVGVVQIFRGALATSCEECNADGEEDASLLQIKMKERLEVHSGLESELLPLAGSLKELSSGTAGWLDGHQHLGAGANWIQESNEPEKQLPADMEGDMKMVDPGAQTYAWDDDAVDVYFVSSPLLSEKLGDKLAHIGLFHSGIAFKNRRSGVVTSSQFYALDFGFNLIFPHYDAEAHKLVWNNSAIVATKEGSVLNTAYWTWTHLVASIKGCHYNQYIKWVEAEAKTTTKYFMFNLGDHGHFDGFHGTGHSISSPASPSDYPPGSVTCFDYAQEVLNHIKTIAGDEVFTKDEKILRNDMFFWAQGGKPRKMNMTAGSDDEGKVFAFYAAVQTLADIFTRESGLKELLAILAHLIEDMELGYAVFHDKNGDYWEYLPYYQVFADYFAHKQSVW